MRNAGIALKRGLALVACCTLTHAISVFAAEESAPLCVLREAKCMRVSGRNMDGR